VIFTHRHGAVTFLALSEEVFLTVDDFAPLNNTQGRFGYITTITTVVAACIISCGACKAFALLNVIFTHRHGAVTFLAPSEEVFLTSRVITLKLLIVQ
jgi:hypothetical protein